ncbi:MAG: peptidoglycan DD-metalloendopeptidase family protein [Eubacteriales bacterium]
MAKTVKTEQGKNIIEKIVIFFVHFEKLIAGVLGAQNIVAHQFVHCIICEAINVVVCIRNLGVNIKTRAQGYRKKYYENEPEKFKIHNIRRRVLRIRMLYLKRNLIEREKRLANRMVHLVNHVDRQNEKLAGKTADMAKGGSEKFNFAREWAEINKKGLIVKLAVGIFFIIAAIATLNYFTAYEYYYNGRLLGIIKKQEDVLKITSIVSEQLSKEHSTKVEINPENDITFKRVISNKSDLDKTEEVLRKLTYMRNINVEAYAIYIDDKKVTVIDNKKDAKRVLDAVMQMYSQSFDNVKYEAIEFKEKVQIKKVDAKLGALEDQNEAVSRLLTGAVKSKIHTVVAGESLSIIAKAYELTLKELLDMNPTLDPTKLPVGQQLVVTKSAPMLTIRTVEVATYLEPIPYPTEKREDSSKYQGEKIVKVSGVNGIKRVTARITRENGVQIAAQELDSIVEEAPVTEVVVEGTKKQPPRKGTGVLKYPLARFTITSRFGTRWGGEFHSGLDLAAPTGTRISAADGGTVVYAGYNPSYGNVVKIDHGGGVMTLYAHCSALMVKNGERVYQGQQIAKVGSTGRSTGPHCHFEVRINGKPKNPLAYL